MHYSDAYVVHAGICGDPFSPRPGEPDVISKFNELPCEPQATYTSGQTITIRMTMPAYHGGFIQIRLCPESNTNPSQACFDANILNLYAAGTSGSCNSATMTKNK